MCGSKGSRHSLEGGGVGFALRKQAAPSCTLECEIVPLLWKTAWQFLKRLNTELTG